MLRNLTVGGTGIVLPRASPSFVRKDRYAGIGRFEALDENDGLPRTVGGEFLCFEPVATGSLVSAEVLACLRRQFRDIAHLCIGLRREKTVVTCNPCQGRDVSIRSCPTGEN